MRAKFVPKDKFVPEKEHESTYFLNFLYGLFIELRELLISLSVFVCSKFKELHLATQSVIFISVLLKWKKRRPNSASS